jgi:hypothetical protein
MPLRLYLLVGLVFSTPGAQERATFSRFFQVIMVADSEYPLLHCTLDIVGRDGEPHARSEVECRGEADQPEKYEKTLGQEEVAKLRSLLAGANLFEGQFWGGDFRGLDLALVTLTVVDDGRAASLVMSFNESFETGGRRELWSYLNEICSMATEGRC